MAVTKGGVLGVKKPGNKILKISRRISVFWFCSVRVVATRGVFRALSISQMSLQLGLLHPRTRWGSLKCSSDFSWVWWATLWQRERQGKTERKSKVVWKKGKNEKQGKGRETTPHNVSFLSWLLLRLDCASYIHTFYHWL